jgi:hypothetical protein
MRAVVDDQGEVIGEFDGNVIRNENGEVLYLISGEDVFSPINKDAQCLSKIPALAIGEFDGKCCTIHGKLIFEIK